MAKSNFNYNKLRGRIKEVCGTQTVFAEAMRRSERSVSAKLNNNRWWTQTDISRACEVLGIDESDIPQYFFVKE